MAQTDYGTDPGLVWRPGLQPPKHAAHVERDGDGWIGICPLGCAFTRRGDHDGAMVDTLNHRNEYH